MQTCRSCQSANLDAAVTCSVCGESLESYSITEAPATPPPYAPPPPQPTYAPPPGYGAPPPPGPPSATVYAPPGTPGGYMATNPTNNMAITSLVLSIVGVAPAPLCYLPILLAPVGAIIGHMALNRIKTSGQEGRGLALAGIIIGWFGTLLAVGVVILIIVLVAAGSGSTT